MKYGTKNKENTNQKTKNRWRDEQKLVVSFRRVLTCHFLLNVFREASPDVPVLIRSQR